MRIQELDALRGVAAFGVFLFHFQLFNYGYLGVHLFFIISGFVILLTANSVKSSSDFVIARISRLYPTYWACVILTSLVLILAGQAISLKQFVLNLSMFQMFLGEKNIDGAYWSLAEELVFYMVVFGALVLGLVRNVRLWGGFMLISAIGGIFLNPELGLQKNLQDVVKYFALFVAGALFYQVYIAPKLKAEHVIGLLLCFAVTIQYQFGKHLSYYNHTYEAIIIGACFGIFTLLVAGKLGFLKQYKWALFIGEISYPFYLLHQEIGLAFRRLFPAQDMWVHIAVVIAIFFGIAAIATLINRYIEKTISKTVKNKLSAWNSHIKWPSMQRKKAVVLEPVSTYGVSLAGDTESQEQSQTATI
ncbi:acyltransferase family protein [Pontibacter oryzae]|uniref:Acyltransferase n=1 Tax=Pontibacter oryzae TaxID=2304593 RepID=A0A399S402_9BACT|nr:acyltransferase [Pontibacter oryzae]RIJ36637.1 acyltransferase [Pontibacter oryzae]